MINSNVKLNENLANGIVNNDRKKLIFLCVGKIYSVNLLTGKFMYKKYLDELSQNFNERDVYKVGNFSQEIMSSYFKLIIESLKTRVCKNRILNSLEKHALCWITSYKNIFETLLQGRKKQFFFYVKKASRSFKDKELQGSLSTFLQNNFNKFRSLLKNNFEFLKTFKYNINDYLETKLNEKNLSNWNLTLINN